MDSGLLVRVPAHITGFFSAHPAADPLQAGSTGAGITLADAITVRIHPASEREILVGNRPTAVPAVEHVLSELDVTARVSAYVEVPLGSGFGVSGAIALACAFGANQLAEDDRSENELIGIAHAGDVLAGTGLGDVVAQHRGGAPIRLEPGAPGYGRLDGIPESRPVEWIARGELSTAEILAGDTEAIDRAGATALEGLREEPTLERLVAESRQFAAEADLLTDQIETIIADVEAVGGHASMAMLGHTVFALDDGLSRAGYDANPHRMASSGVRIVGPEAQD